jgi:ribosomal protein S6--L-glutamate ligase
MSDGSGDRLRLAVATDAETLTRVRAPLRERGIVAEHLPTAERTVDLRAPETAAFDVGFVFPSRPMEGGVADAVLAVPWVNDREAVLTSRNKAGVLAALADAGVPTPRSVYVSNPVDDEAVARAVADAGIEAPYVLKPNSATRGVGVCKVHDRDSLSGATDYLDLVHDFRATGDRSYLVQEFLPDARDLRLMVVGGACVGGVERRLPGDETDGNGTPGDGDPAGVWKHNVHRGAVATAVDPDDRLRALAERVSRVLEVDYLGVDLLVTDDRVVVSETNARPTVDDADKYDPGFYDRLARLVRQTAGEG